MGYGFYEILQVIMMKTLKDHGTDIGLRALTGSGESFILLTLKVIFKSLK